MFHMASITSFTISLPIFGQTPPPPRPTASFHQRLRASSYLVTVALKISVGLLGI